MAVLDPPASGARVRMYRPNGLGDCFLIAFRADDGTATYVLIDCGVFNGTSGGSARMRAIATDVAEATGGRLDVLVVTHEHWDHLSGFQYARETFESLDIREVWTAWTEDPTDPLAVRLQRERDATFGALSASVQRMRASPRPALRAQADEVGRLMDFMGERAPDDEPLAPARFSAKGRSGRGTAAQMDLALSLGDRIRYLKPGDAPLGLRGVSGVEVFALGPPRDEALLRRSDPRVGEVYDHTHGDLSSSTSDSEPPTATVDPVDFGAAVTGVDAPGPFARSVGVPLDTLRSASDDTEGAHGQLRRFFESRYGTEDSEAAAWRRIDGDWLGTAEALALQLDSDTNNSSLVLAFRLPDGRVLLFPGDAQVGNWTSWHDVGWDREDGTRLTGTDLVRDTALYKVGHHASHNATLRDRGLELMGRPDLVALVPVDQDQAAGKDWAMPFPPLLDRLVARCAGRVVRADLGLPDRPEGIPEEAWAPFLALTDESPDGLWVQVDVSASDV